VGRLKGAAVLLVLAVVYLLDRPDLIPPQARIVPLGLEAGGGLLPSPQVLVLAR
jgi:hypothetical protein